MPELPEVEVTRRQLMRHLVGRQIKEVITAKKSYFFLTPPTKLQQQLTGRTVQSLTRHGKYLLAQLDDKSSLLLHLGMTGRLFPSVQKSEGNSRALPQHTHLVLHFADGKSTVQFRDVRKFGKVKWLPPGARDSRLEQLGIDALEANGKTLFDASRKRRAPIKTVVLDQSVLAGVGNIYADEALFLARVRPTRGARRVGATECDLIVAAAQQVMLRSIQAGGSTFRDFVAPSGQQGSYQQQHSVYGRAGEPCPVCGNAIRRIVVGTRSTHYCPQCQK
ncbi:MAG TPA: bifunctional DNA-formamidopyrimidine glycosylase/DNA-(apurinic or apyrimidinic site) lyase [Polyangiaceae bacterium]|nr:bifunctional DNA-formamidopyrimidine glycosylase/DNA-(apurinic or apyrimidinic site) lyase [Polyangiaceae bacterium]